MAVNALIFRSGDTGTITLPGNWNNNDNFIMLIGAGAGGSSSCWSNNFNGTYNFNSGGGGGSGAFILTNNVQLVPGETYNYQTGVGGLLGTDPISNGNPIPDARVGDPTRFWNDGGSIELHAGGGQGGRHIDYTTGGLGGAGGTVESLVGQGTGTIARNGAAGGNGATRTSTFGTFFVP